MEPITAAIIAAPTAGAASGVTEAVLYNSCAKDNVLGGPLKDRTARERNDCAPRRGFSLREMRAEKGGASGVLQILRRVESGVNT